MYIKSEQTQNAPKIEYLIADVVKILKFGILCRLSFIGFEVLRL